MNMYSAIRATADRGGEDHGRAAGGPMPVNANSFRLLTARLKSGRSAVSAVPDPLPELVPAPIPESMPEPASEPTTEPAAEIPPPRREREPGEEAGDTAITLLELMAATAGLQPQERVLAADTLLLLLPRMPAHQLVRLAERVAIMDNPPPLLVASLIRDPRPEVMAPVLERNAFISDLDMIDNSATQDVERLRIIARRRTLSPLLCTHVVAGGEPGALLALLRNAGAQLPHQCFVRLAELAVDHPALLAPLVTRAELPASVAFELFWSLPPELRRLILSRFLADSLVLGKILRIILAEDRSLATGAPREDGPVAAEALDAALQAAAAAQMEEAVQRFADLAGISTATVRRILSDPHGEPAAVLLKALGISRGRFVEAMDRLRALTAQPDERASPQLQSVFDGLSFNKARVLLSYWDWATRKAGPYAPRS